MRGQLRRQEEALRRQMPRVRVLSRACRRPELGQFFRANPLLRDTMRAIAADPSQTSTLATRDGVAPLVEQLMKHFAKIKDWKYAPKSDEKP